MKLGVISPRYGSEVIGGTEHWLRNLCEHLVAMCGWEVEVYTTCARQATTWADEYRPGLEELNGVAVHRHPSVSGRNPDYLHMYPKLSQDMESVSEAEAERFVELVGPVCPAVIEHAEQSDADLIAVTPYLYWPAVVGVPRLGRRVIFHGAAHDEVELRLPLMPSVFESVGGFSYNTFAERDLVERTFRVAHLPSRVVGNAVQEGPGDPATARIALGLGPDEPFVLSVSRIERSKGSQVLADMWSLYRRQRPDAPRLVMVGPLNDEIHVESGVVLAGQQSDEVKWGALRACSFLVAAGAQESFGLTILEAWLSGKAALVNGRCAPAVELCRRAEGGLWFDQYGDFAETCNRLVDDPSLTERLAASGQDFARREFSWDSIVRRYQDLAAEVLHRAALLKGCQERH